jgi:ATP-dependent DNA ligase
VLEGFRSLPADDVVLDGELVLIRGGELDFDALQLRLHPAESRVRLLARQTPATYVAFDLLAEGARDLRRLPLAERRERLWRLLEHPSTIRRTPVTDLPAVARNWFSTFEGAGLDGVVAKLASQPYLPGRRAWVKVKHRRTADCVVIGFRRSSDGSSLGSLLLGLYDRSGALHYVGHTTSFGAIARKEVMSRLEPLIEQPPERWGRRPGGPSRWSRGRDTAWVSVRPELVCEVAYDKLQGGERFRHAVGFVRWRSDKPPAACGFDQIASVRHLDVTGIFPA